MTSRFWVRCIAALCVVCAFAPAPAQAAKHSAKLGVYVDWERAKNTAAFEQWLGHPVDLGLDYTNGSSWSGFDAYSDWAPAYWASNSPGHNVCWSIQLCLGGTTLAQVAAGSNDADFAHVAAKIAQYQPNAIIRLGWEMNGTWFAWATAGHDKDFIAAFRHVVPIFRKASPHFLIDWCPNIGYPGGDPAPNCYPGDDVVDIIGMDIYDKNSSPSHEATWDGYLNGEYGLKWQARFAAKHHKPMSYPEWGVGDSGDDPYFVQHMYDWIESHNVAYSDYWNSNAGGDKCMLTNNQNPKTSALFIKLFGTPHPAAASSHS